MFELSLGVDRSLYTLLETSVRVDGERRSLALRPYISPLKAGIFPLVNKDGLPELARRVFSMVADELDVFTDESGSIGRRYARADDIGVPCCITVDYDSLKDGTVTVRDRDSRSQKRIKIDSLGEMLSKFTRYPPVFA